MVNLSRHRNTVIPVCEIIQVDTVNVGHERAFGWVPVSLWACLEAVTVEVVAAVIARPVGERERRCCRLVLTGVSSHGQVRVSERRGGLNRRRVGISRLTTICIDYRASERGNTYCGTQLTVSNRLHTIAVLGEQVGAVCIDIFV